MSRVRDIVALVKPRIMLMVVATVLVATYYVTSLDAGTYALADFVSAPKQSGPWFRVILVFSIASVTTVLLTLGGSAVVDTVQQKADLHHVVMQT